MVYVLEGVSARLADREILSELSFSVAARERVVILGATGSGKTTLLKILDGLVQPSKGLVRYEDRSLDGSALGEGGFRRRFRSEVGLLFQSVDAMLFNATVADEIAFVSRQLGVADVDARVQRWAAAFGVDGWLDRSPFALSGGEKKRVALAALLASEPKLLLLDEPMAGLDPAARAQLLGVLAERPELTVISATHTVAGANELGSRVLLLPPRPGRLLYDGPHEGLAGQDALWAASGLGPGRPRGGE